MKQFIISIGLSLIFILNFNLSQANNPEKRNRGEYREKGQHGMMHEKMLTEDQKEIFEEIRMGSMKESKAIRDELRELRAHHQTLMTAEKPELSKIYASIDKMGELKTKLEKINAKGRVEMSSHLTEEQKLRMSDFKKSRNGRNHHVDKGKRYQRLSE